MLKPRFATALSIVVALLALNGCNNGSDRGRGGGSAGADRGGGGDAGSQPPAASRRGTSRPGAAAATQPTEFTGTLRGGTVAIGGETTGWRLEGDGATGGIDVDVSKVRQRAQALDGKRVQVTGRMTTRNWVERGEQQVLVAERIEEAPPRAAGAPGPAR